MTRSDLLTYLSEIFKKITADLNITPADSTTAFKYALDMAFRRLGVSESSLPTAEVTGDQVEQAVALAEYYSLRRFWTHVATRVDYPAEGMMQSRSQIFRQIGDLLKEAEKRCESLGVSVSGGAQLVRTAFYLDYLEPVTEEYANG